MFSSDTILVEIFNIVLLGCVITFGRAVYIFGGFDNREILRVLQGERKARYNYIVRHLRVAFLFLFASIIMAAAFNIFGTFVLYDLAIHYVAIGFLGITIALYLPLMLLPITGRIVRFTKFNSLPLSLIIAALAIRTSGGYYDDVVATGHWQFCILCLYDLRLARRCCTFCLCYNGPQVNEARGSD